MLAIKNWAGKRWLVILAACVLPLGCSPPGERALTAGRRLLRQGKYAEAVHQLAIATATLPTNALAWNELGLACQYSGQTTNAERAYRKAMALDHDLSEAHYNLGCLWLSQNNLDAAQAEFTAYTLRREIAAEGFLKLGTVQLRQAERESAATARARDLGAAEKSFNEALRLASQSPEAHNGLGLVRLQRGHPGDAAECFKAALNQQPDYAPALLNLAIVSQQYLRDPREAMQRYRQYLGVKPEPANANAVAAVVQRLEQEATGFQSAASGPARPAPDALRPPARDNSQDPGPAAAPSSAKTEVLKVPAGPAVRAAQGTSAVSTQVSSTEPAAASVQPSASDTDAKPGKRTFLQNINPINLFQRERKPADVAVLPGSPSLQPDSTTAAGAGFTPLVNRYAFNSPGKPRSGNREFAERFFAHGVKAQESGQLPAAVKAYRSATDQDPSFYEAQYNLGLAASQAGDARTALAAYEYALAIRPDSLPARYNFALLLQQANYPADAANEFEKLLTAHPNETRAHLALANLYAQQLRQPAKARLQYLKVLDAEPHHPQADAIRSWLTNNPT